MSQARGNGWICEFTDDGIEVSSRTKRYGIYNLLLEPYCSICAFPGVETDECPWAHDPNIDQTIAMGVYYPYRHPLHEKDLLSNHITGVKRYLNYAKPLGLSMALSAKHVYNGLKEFDALVPIPKHQTEYKEDKETGAHYNQALLLGRIVGRELDKPLVEAVAKSRPWSQRGQTIQERINLPDNLYVPVDDANVRVKSILLIDDVRTSGGTGIACAKALLKAGAKKVSLFVAGRDAGSDQEG